MQHVHSESCVFKAPLNTVTTQRWRVAWSSLFWTGLDLMSRTWPAGRAMPTPASQLISGWTLEHLTCVFRRCRFGKEYSSSPGRGYGSGVIQVLKKLASPQLADVYQPAKDQFNGRGSFGNGGAMRAAPFALAFPDLANVKRVSDDHVMFKNHTPSMNGKDLHSSVRFPFCSLPVLVPCWHIPARWVITGLSCKHWQFIFPCRGH